MQETAIYNHDPDVLERLEKQLRRGRLAVFCGAGISMAPPTSLPSWRALSDGMVTALGETAGIPDAQTLAKHVCDSRLAPEKIAQALHDAFGDAFYNSLDFLMKGEPNLNHIVLAALAKTGRLPVIVTANFDTFIERALTSLDVPFQSIRRDEEFEAVADEIASEEGFEGVRVIKIHGCIEAKDTIKATVRETSQGFPAAKKRALRAVFDHYHVLFLGYSGNDLNMDANKFAMHDAQQTARGFSWCFLPGETNEMVEQLCRDYKGRGQRFEGKLPGLLVELQVRVNPSPMSKDMQAWAQALPAKEHLRVLGELLHHGQQLDDARTAYELYNKQAPDDPARAARTFHNLGVVGADLGQGDEALAHYEKALAIERQHGFKKEEAETLHQMGTLAQMQGDLQQALDHYQASFKLRKELGEPLAPALGQIGSVFHEQGDLDKALEFYGKAKALQEGSGDREGLAATLHALGMIHDAQDDQETALREFQMARTIEGELGIKRGLTATLNAIGVIYLDQGKLVDAEMMFKEAKQTAEDIGDRSGEASSCLNLGVIAGDQQNPDLRHWYLDRALDLTTGIGDKIGQADVLTSLGDHHAEANDAVEAKKAYDQASALYTECGLTEMAEDCRSRAAALG